MRYFEIKYTAITIASIKYSKQLLTEYLKIKFNLGKDSNNELKS